MWGWGLGWGWEWREPSMNQDHLHLSVSWTPPQTPVRRRCWSEPMTRLKPLGTLDNMAEPVCHRLHCDPGSHPRHGPPPTRRSHQSRIPHRRRPIQNNESRPIQTGRMRHAELVDHCWARSVSGMGMPCKAALNYGESWPSPCLPARRLGGSSTARS